MTALCAAETCDSEPSRGLLCPTHHRRLSDALGAREGIGEPGRESHGLPWLWSHLAAAWPSLSSLPAPGGRAHVGDPEAERLTAVLGVRDDIRDTLASWTADTADRHRMAGPIGVRCFTDRPPVGTDRLVVLRCAAWLLRNVELLECHASVPELLAELEDLMSRGHALAPWRPAPTLVQGIPCRCGVVGAIHDHGDLRKCWRCGKSYTAEEWRILTVVLARRFDPAREVAMS